MRRPPDKAQETARMVKGTRVVGWYIRGDEEESETGGA
jgi:hypothetical protein